MGILGALELESEIPLKRWGVVRRVVVLGVVCGVLIVAVATARTTVIDALGALRRADLWWIVAAAAAQLIVYASLGEMLRRLLRDEVGFGWCTCAGLALVVFGLGGIMPASPAEGVTVATVELHRRGVPTGRAAGTLVLSEWIRVLSLVVLFAFDRVIAVARGRTLRLGIGPVIGSSVLILVLVALVAAVVSSRRTATVATGLMSCFRGRHDTSEPMETRSAELHATMTRVLGSRGNRLAVTGAATVGWIADAACLTLCVRALGDDLGIDAVLLAYAIGAVVSLIPLLPGGLGAVEIAVPAVIHQFGVPLDTALAATLAWRAISLVAPAVVGVGSLAWLRRQPGVTGSPGSTPR